MEFEPAGAARATAMLSALLTPVWSTSQPFIDQLLKWERACEEYVEASGVPLSDQVRCAVVARWAPEPARGFLRMSPVDYTENYAGLRNALLDYHARGRFFTAEGTVSRSENTVSAAYQGQQQRPTWQNVKGSRKGGGKEGGRGSGKGGGKDAGKGGSKGAGKGGGWQSHQQQQQQQVRRRCYVQL